MCTIENLPCMKEEPKVRIAKLSAIFVTTFGGRVQPWKTGWNEPWKDRMNHATEVVKKVKLFHVLQRCIFLTTESTLYYSHFKGCFFTVQPSPHLHKECYDNIILWLWTKMFISVIKFTLCKSVFLQHNFRKEIHEIFVGVQVDVWLLKRLYPDKPEKR